MKSMMRRWTDMFILVEHLIQNFPVWHWSWHDSFQEIACRNFPALKVPYELNLVFGQCCPISSQYNPTGSIITSYLLSSKRLVKLCSTTSSWKLVPNFPYFGEFRKFNFTTPKVIECLGVVIYLHGIKNFVAETRKAFMHRFGATFGHRFLKV